MRFSLLGRSAILAAVTVALVVTSSSAQWFGRNKIQYKDHEWKVLSTPHFDIHFYQGSESFATRAGLVLEDGYEMLSYKLKVVMPWRIPVILYSSHNDFLQTNVTRALLSEGVQAFAEPSRRRIVLPFTSSFKEFAHTAVHELAHVFTFHIVYNRIMDNVFTRSYLFPMELWIAEGVAEYLSVKWDTDADMYIRDAVIHDYLFPLSGLSGYYVYKEGQSAFNYIEETYGAEKISEILRVLANTRNADVALERTIGLSTREFAAQWSKALKKHYWPLYPDKVEVTDYGRRLTDHIKDYGYYNTKPTISPDGEIIAFFSDRDGLIDIYLMSALDGKIIRKLVSGHRSNRFESLHFMNSAITFSPDGENIAFVARSKGHDTIFIVETESGDMVKKIDIPDASGLAAPNWSPTKSEIVISATFSGQTDLLLVDVDEGKYQRLTNDAADQLTPRFFPDGKKVVYTYYPEITIDVPEDFSGDNLDVLGEMNFLGAKNVLRGGSYDIWEYNINTRRARALVESEGDNTEPLVMSDGVTLVYTSDESGINNLYTGSLETGEFHRVTDVLGGIFSPDVNETTGRIAFSAFRQAGNDVFISDDLNGVLSQRVEEQKKPPLMHVAGETPYDAPWIRNMALASAKRTVAEETIPGADSTTGIADPVSMQDDPTNLDSYAPPIIITRDDPEQDQNQPDGTSGVDNGGRGVRAPSLAALELGEEEEFYGGKVQPYKTRLAPDFIGQGAGVYMSTGFGFGISNSIAMSDLLGNHRLGLAFAVYGDISESDFLLSYFYLKHRIDYGVGIYQFKNYLNSRITSVGESFGSYRLFSERNIGLFGTASIPFSKYYRMDLELQTYLSFREFYDQTSANPYALWVTSGRSTRRLLEPSLTFVHDSSFWGYFGPVEGSRWRLSVSRGIAFSDKEVSRTTVYLDYRWYKMLFFRNSLAIRLMGAMSEGRDPRIFFLGGPMTLRGYDYLKFEGNRLALGTIEYRFPLLDAIVFGWPGRWGFRNIGGTVFFDAGAAWFNDDAVFLKHGVDHFALNDLAADFGFGTYVNMGYFLLNFQFAWSTDLHKTQDYQFHFYLGPTF